VTTVLHILAHAGEVHEDAARSLWTMWPLEPYTWAILALAAWLYIRGLRRMWSGGGGIKPSEAWCYAGGWFALFVALVTPLHPLGSFLFSAHMTQHEILMLIAAPLLVLGRPILVYLKALPPRWAHDLGNLSNRAWWQNTWQAISNPFSAWLIHAAALWLWHVPRLFEATLRSDIIHALQHISFLASAVLFWWSVMHGRQRAAAFGMAVLYMFTTALHSGLLGILITFAGRVIYPSYTNTTRDWGFSPLEDQQLGGIIMWIPAGIAYIVAGLIFFAGWLRESDRRLRRRESINIQPVAPLILLALLIMSGCESKSEQQARNLTSGDITRGREQILAHGCSSCHTIPGVRGADGVVGPPLTHIASRPYLGGVLRNTPVNLQRWIANAPAVDPQTAMPNLKLNPDDARDISAYLYTLR
jgi:putative membrane protein